MFGDRRSDHPLRLLHSSLCSKSLRCCSASIRSDSLMIAPLLSTSMYGTSSDHEFAYPLWTRKILAVSPHPHAHDRIFSDSSIGILLIHRICPALAMPTHRADGEPADLARRD